MHQGSDFGTTSYLGSSVPVSPGEVCPWATANENFLACSHSVFMTFIQRCLKPVLAVDSFCRTKAFCV